MVGLLSPLDSSLLRSDGQNFKSSLQVLAVSLQKGIIALSSQRLITSGPRF
jgi:hypothetical protein